jgi:hypothetical protein
MTVTMRMAVGAMVVAAGQGDGQQFDVLGGIDDADGAEGVDGLVNGGLEAAQEDDQVSGVQVAGGNHGKLEVVRVSRWRGQVGYLNQITTHLLRHKLQRIERRHHLEPFVFDSDIFGGARRRATTGECRDQGQRDEGTKGPLDVKRFRHENDSQLKLRTIRNYGAG